MYVKSNMGDRSMMAFSVPPSVHPDLSEDFAELSRIHFYLGRQPIDFMIKAVEAATPEEIEKGTIQIHFAYKEISQYLFSTLPDIKIKESDENKTSVFDIAFKNILNHALEVLEYAYEKPTRKDNSVEISTMMGLTHEVLFLNSELKKANIETINLDDTLSQIKDNYQKIYSLKEHYPQLSSLKEFNSYEIDAKNSVVKQLEEPFLLDYKYITSMVDDDSWMRTLQELSKEREKTKDVNHVYNIEQSQQLKEKFLTQLKSFNRLLSNGVVNYVYAYLTSAEKQALYTVTNSQVSPEQAFNKKTQYLEYCVKEYKHRNYGSDYKEELKEHLDNKDSFINTERKKRASSEIFLTFLHRYNHNITSTLDKLRQQLLNVSVKPNINFEGNIKTGFVIGTFSDEQKVLLIHKDPFVNVVEAVYAGVLHKSDYDQLVANNKLAFSEEFKKSNFISASNFWSYGQFLNEIKDSYVQNFFLGREYDLVDETTLTINKNVSSKNKTKKM